MGEVVEDCNPDCMVVVYAVDDKQSFGDFATNNRSIKIIIIIIMIRIRIMIIITIIITITITMKIIIIMIMLIMMIIEVIIIMIILINFYLSQQAECCSSSVFGSSVEHIALTSAPE